MSKSVKLSTNAAMTGIKKKIAIATRAGERNSRAARTCSLPLPMEVPPLLLFMRQPPSFFKYDVDLAVQGGKPLFHAHPVHRDQLPVLAHLLGNLFPFWNLRSRNDVFQLFEERRGVLVVCERRILPCRHARRQISREAV